MASPTTTTATATTTFMERLTYRCHCCNCDVSPSPSSSSSSSATATSTSLLCPNCNCDCLEQVLSTNNPNPNYPNNLSSQLSFPSFDPSIPTTTAGSTTRTFPFPSVTASDDNFLLDSPYLHRLINHLTNSSDSSSPSTTTITTSLRQSPTSKSAIEAIPLIKITSDFLDIDPIVLCAVCKDQFLIDDETKQLPCKHMYHPDCILPWLSQHNSCPVCRFQMPREPITGDVKVRRRSRSRVLRLGDLMEDVDDEAMLGIGFSNLHHQYMHSAMEPEVMFPLTHIGQTVDVDVLPDSGQVNSLETAGASWPNWHVNRVAVDGGENSVIDDDSHSDAVIML